MTFNAVASFAAASYRRLLLMQLIIAFAAAASTVWTLRLAWIPGIEEAISRLPDRGEIRDARLDWEDKPAIRLTEGPFISIEVNLEERLQSSQIADLRFELRRNSLRLQSLFGYLDVPYLKGWRVALNRPELEPSWGAWKPFLLAGIGLAVVLQLLFSWCLLAALYTIPVRMLAFYLDREVSWAGCWRLAAASLFPGSAVMTGAILLYGSQQLNLLGLLIAIPLHLIIGWIYVSLSPAYLRRLPSVISTCENPFAGRAPTT